MSWVVIWNAIHRLLKGLEDPSRWKMSIDGKRNEAPTAVHVGPDGIRFTFDTSPMTGVLLEASAGIPQYAVVKVNGVVDEDARLVFALKHQLLKPMIVVFEFKDVTIDGVTQRYRFDCPK